MNTGKYIGNKCIARFLLAVFVAACVLFPLAAQAVEVSSQTLRPNGIAQTGVVGGKKTRLNWEAKIADGEQLSSLELTFPKGTSLSKATADVSVITGTKKSKVGCKTTVGAGTITVTFNAALSEESTIRILVQDLSFPASGGTFTVLASETIGAVTSPIKSDASLLVKKASLAERMITYLDGAAWVEKWTEVPVLNMFLKPQLIVAGLVTQFVGWTRALGLVAAGFPLAIPIGLLIALLRMSKIAPFRFIASIFINVIRGTPLFLQIYIAFFGLPLVGVHVNDYVLGIAVLAMNSSAYLAEIFRSGIQSIDKGQFEAASSLGMSGGKTMIFVIIPQTVRRVLPTMTSEFILLYKDTALLAAVGVMELMMFSKNLVATTGNVTPYVVAAFYYMIVTLPLIRLVGSFEKRLAVAEGGTVTESKKSKKSKKRAPALVLGENHD